MPVPLRSAVSGLPAYVAGRPAPARDDLVTYKLSSNENPFPPLPGVLEAVAQAAASMNRYPDIANALTTEALAGPARRRARPARLRHGVGRACSTTCCRPSAVPTTRSCTPGAASRRTRSRCSSPVPAGSACRWAAAAEHDLDAMLAAVGPSTRAVLLCSPNNPTGPALRHDEVVAFVDAVPDDVLVVVDEAYVEFVTDPSAVRGLEVAQGRDNVVVLRTFSKAYGLAGFRVGYCVAEPRLAQAVRSVALPFGVSLPAQAAVLASLEPGAGAARPGGRARDPRDALAAGLREVGLPVPDAQGNFVWIPAGARTAEVAATFGEAGLVVRPYVSDHPGDGVRITVGEPEANARVLEVAARLGKTVGAPA